MIVYDSSGLKVIVELLSQISIPWMFQTLIKIKLHWLEFGSRSEFIGKRCDFICRRLWNVHNIYIMHDANEVVHLQMDFSLYNDQQCSFPHFWKLMASIVLCGWHVLTAGAFTFVKTTDFVVWIGVILCSSSKLNTVQATRATISSVCSAEVAADKLCGRLHGSAAMLLWFGILPWVMLANFRWGPSPPWGLENLYGAGIFFSHLMAPSNFVSEKPLTP